MPYGVNRCIMSKQRSIVVVKENTPEDIKQALEYLLHVVSGHNGAVVVGYVFCNEPLFISSVSNVKEGQFNGTLETIHQLAKTKQAQGLVVKNKVRPNV